MHSLRGQTSSMIYILSEGPLCVVLHGVRYYVYICQKHFSHRGLMLKESAFQRFQVTGPLSLLRPQTQRHTTFNSVYSDVLNGYTLDNLCYNAPSIYSALQSAIRDDQQYCIDPNVAGSRGGGSTILWSTVT
jgi:hypothetical protein